MGIYNDFNRIKSHSEVELPQKPKARLSGVHITGIVIGVIILIILLIPLINPSSSQAPSSYQVPQPIRQETEKLLEISIWEATEIVPLKEKTEIWVKGYGSWFPNLTNGSDKRAFGKYRVGEVNEFFIYPDGRNRTEMRVQFRMTDDMISGSTMSQTLININDYQVEVVGQAIDGNSVIFKR